MLSLRPRSATGWLRPASFFCTGFACRGRVSVGIGNKQNLMQHLELMEVMPERFSHGVSAWRVLRQVLVQPAASITSC